MGTLLSQLIPTAIVGAVSPLPIIVVINLLVAKDGLAKAIAFTGGLVGAFTAVGVIALASAETDAGSTDTGGAVTGTVIAALGAVLFVYAVKLWLEAPDPNAPPPKFMARLDQMSAPRAALLGLIMAVVNVKQIGIYLAGVSMIVSADVSAAQGWVALVLLLVVIQIVPIASIAIYLFARDGATRVLEAFRGWLIANNRPISIVIGLVVGAAFLVKGITTITG